MRRRRKGFLISLIFLGGLFLCFVAALFVVDYVVVSSAKEKLHYQTSDVGEFNVGMILGTSKYLIGGGKNQYYQNRIEGITEVYKAGKINYILVSGDNSQKEYDEPQTIRRDLEAVGIPRSKIYLDFAGFRTFDSMVRAKSVFGQDRILVVSQKFHLERALFIANWMGMDCEGLVIESVGMSQGLPVLIREKFARVKMLMDLLWGIQPRYMGDPILIPTE